MLHRYLNWIGYSTKAFNAGDYRRKVWILERGITYSWDLQVNLPISSIQRMQQQNCCVISSQHWHWMVCFSLFFSWRSTGLLKCWGRCRHLWCYEYNERAKVWEGRSYHVDKRFWNDAGMQISMFCSSRVFVMILFCWRRITKWSYQIQVELVCSFDS